MKVPTFALIMLILTLVGLSANAQPKEGSQQPPTKKEQAARFHAEVMILHATNSQKGIDERIGKMPELKKPPFSAYDSYKLLAKESLPLKKNDPETIRLPNGRVLRTQLLNVLPNNFLKISASINQPQGKSFLPLLEVKAKVGHAFIVAGPKHKNGILVLVIRALQSK